MRVRILALTAALVFVGGQAVAAPGTHKCKKERWEELATRWYGKAELAQLLARFNRANPNEPCPEGRFVRFPMTIQHEMRLGQPLASLVGRFLQAPGALALLRTHNHIPEGTEPNPGTIIEIPAELELAVGSRPEAELAEIPGLPALTTIRAYNGVGETEPLPAGGTIYVPLFLRATGAGGVAAVVPTKKNTAPPEPPKTRTSTTSSAKPTLAIRSIPGPDEVTLADFDHEDHRPLIGEAYACASCHVGPADQPYPPIPESTCRTCHQRVSPDVGPRLSRLDLHFPHDVHLSRTGKMSELGYEADCESCHPEQPHGQRGRPAHDNCIRCHNKLELAPAVDGDCEACHLPSEQKNRLLLASTLLDEHFRGGPSRRDFSFSHGPHIAQLGGASAPTTQSCDPCHASARTAIQLSELEPMSMAGCLACHRGLERRMGEDKTRLDRCKSCHVALRADMSPSFLNVADKPTSHTLVFRRQHRQAAEADQGVCQACHTPLAGGLGAECNACHSKLRPRDHTARWREEPHGRSALREGIDRCATCHTRDRCADCHALAPRDHFPKESFRLRHGVSARVSIRRCQTCHLPQVDCARCHDIGGL